ncbi:unnamed protein product [Discosporangium mesarthrocarpum]
MRSNLNMRLREAQVGNPKGFQELGRWTHRGPNCRKYENMSVCRVGVEHAFGSVQPLGILRSQEGFETAAEPSWEPLLCGSTFD